MARIQHPDWRFKFFFLDGSGNYSQITPIGQNRAPLNPKESFFNPFVGANVEAKFYMNRWSISILSTILHTKVDYNTTIRMIPAGSNSFDYNDRLRISTIDLLFSVSYHLIRHKDNTKTDTPQP